MLLRKPAGRLGEVHPANEVRIKGGVGEGGVLTFGPKNAALAGKSRIVTKRRYMRCFVAADAEKGDFGSRYCFMWWVSTSGCRVSKNIAICGIFCPVQLKQWQCSSNIPSCGLGVDCRKIVVYAGVFCPLLVRKVISQKTLLYMRYILPDTAETGEFYSVL